MSKHCKFARLHSHLHKPCGAAASYQIHESFKITIVVINYSSKQPSLKFSIHLGWPFEKNDIKVVRELKKNLPKKSIKFKLRERIKWHTMYALVLFVNVLAFVSYHYDIANQ